MTIPPTPVPPLRYSPFRLAISRHGFSATTLAEALGCSRTHLAHVLNGRRELVGDHRARALQLGFTEPELSTDELGPEETRAAVLADQVVAARRQQGLPDHLDNEQVVTAIARILAKALVEAEKAPKAASR